MDQLVKGLLAVDKTHTVSTSEGQHCQNYTWPGMVKDIWPLAMTLTGFPWIYCNLTNVEP